MNTTRLILVGVLLLTMLWLEFMQLRVDELLINQVMSNSDEIKKLNE